MTDEADRSSAPPRVLRRLVEELRAEEGPALDWAAMEERLLGRIDTSPAGGASEVDTSGVVDLLGGRQPGDAPDTGRAARVDEARSARGTEGAHATVVVPWDDDPADDVDAEGWRSVRRPAAGDVVASAEGCASAPPAPAGARRTRWAAALVAVAAALCAGWALGGGAGLAGGFGLRAGLGSDGGPGSDDGRGSGRGHGSSDGHGPVDGLGSGGPVSRGDRAGPTDGGQDDVGSVDLAVVAREPRVEGALDLASLRGGDVVEAAEGPVRFARDGFATWELSAGGRLRIVSGIGHGEPRHVVALEAGALDVEVVPATGERVLERFVVEVGGARVAVHGTAFRVVRSRQGIVVDVTRGVVAVGPRDGAPGTGHRLEAPQRAAFGLDGGGYRPLPRRATDARATDEHHASAAVADPDAALPEAPRASSSATPPGEVAQPLPRAERELAASDADGTVVARPASTAAAPRRGSTGAAEGRTSLDALRAEVSACIAERGAGSSEVRVTLSSRLVVDVGPAGAPRHVRFDPPIRPDLQACAEPVFGRRLSAEGVVALPLEVVLEPRRDR